MKQYTYNYVGGIPDAWHDGGGLVIVTEGDPQQALNRYYADNPLPHDKSIPLLPDTPDHTYELVGTPEERVLIFPDIGCC